LSTVSGQKLIVSVKKFRPGKINFIIRNSSIINGAKRQIQNNSVYPNSPTPHCASFVKPLWIKCSEQIFPRIISTDVKVEKSYMENSSKTNDYTEHSHNLAKLMSHMFNVDRTLLHICRWRSDSVCIYFQEKISDHRI
jgi:hypothetical protein